MQILIPQNQWLKPCWCTFYVGQCWESWGGIVPERVVEELVFQAPDNNLTARELCEFANFNFSSCSGWSCLNVCFKKKSLSFLFQLCGCGLLGVGIWLSVSQGNFATFSPSFPSLSAANMVIAIGTIVMVTGFLGCLGAIKENKCLLLSVSRERQIGVFSFTKRT